MMCRSACRAGSEAKGGGVRSCRPSLIAHRNGDKRSGEKSEHTNASDRPGQAEGVTDYARKQGSDRVAQVTPEPVDAERASAPGRVRYIRDCRNQSRVDHRCAKPEQDAGDEPPRKTIQ